MKEYLHVIISKIKTHKRRTIIVIIAMLFTFFLLEDALIFYNKAHNNNPILGEKLTTINVSKMTKEQIVAFIKKKFDSTMPLQLTYQGKVFTVRKEDIGASIDYGATLDRLNATGRKGNLAKNILDQNKAILGLNRNKLVVHVSNPLLLLKVIDIESRINQQPQPQMPDFSGDLNNTLPKRDGVKVVSSKLSAIILNNIFNPPNGLVTIPTEKVVKKFPAYDLAKIRQQAAEYIAEPLSITSGGQTFTLTSQDLQSLLTLAEQVDPTNPQKNIIVLTLDNAKLSQKLYPFATKVESVTHSEFNDHDSLAAIYGQFYTNTRRVIDVPTGPTAVSNVFGITTNSNEKVVYLTFDDGPNIIYQPMLLDMLHEKGVKATFYFVGSNSKLYANTTIRTIQEGHVIGDHSLTHAYLAKLLPNQIIDEIKTTRDILNGFFEPNKKITLFRPPYGGTNALVEKDARDLGLKQELWTVDPKDWSDPSTDELVKRVVDHVQNGSVVLLHSNHFSTVKALPLIIDKLRAKGYEFKTQQ